MCLVRSFDVMPIEQLLQPWTLVCFALAGMATTFLGFALCNTRLVASLPKNAAKPTNKVSVLIPARNEQRCIEDCVRSVCQQDVDDLEVIVLNDQSEDDTGPILERLAGEFSNLQVIQGLPLPPGWVGKVWACHNLALAATGDILIFTDADTIHRPGLIARSIQAMQKHDLAMLSLIPRQIMTTFAEHAVIPIVHMIFFATMLNFRRIGFGRTTPLAAIGQFIAFTREGYKDLGGHERVRSSLVEDVFLAKAAASEGIRFALADGTDAIDCHMYTSAHEVTLGFSKNLFPAMQHNIALMAAFLLLQFGLYIAPLPMVAAALYSSSMPDTLILLYTIATTLVIRLIVSTRFAMPSWHALIQPVTALWCMVICLNSLRWAYSRSGSQWKGRFYARKELH